jgi:putative heme transporter
VPDALAAAVTLIGAVGLLSLLFSVLAPQVAAELEGLAENLEAGYLRLRRYVESGPLGLPGFAVDDFVTQLRERLTTEGAAIAGGVLEAGAVVIEGVAAAVFGLLALFFYLKDGPRIAAWARDLFPRRLRADVQAIGDRAWFTIGAYIRGVLIIGMVDAVAIGIGLFVLRVPLALPLAVLVFFGALFPIVGAFTAGTVAVLVALATNGPAAAFAVLILILVVQQVEGHILTPILLSRATQLHPLAVVAALAAGGVLAGILGAFLAVPVAASLARAVAYIRTRTVQ